MIHPALCSATEVPVNMLKPGDRFTLLCHLSDQTVWRVQKVAPVTKAWLSIDATRPDGSQEELLLPADSCVYMEEVR